VLCMLSVPVENLQPALIVRSIYATRALSTVFPAEEQHHSVSSGGRTERCSVLSHFGEEVADFRPPNLVPIIWSSKVSISMHIYGIVVGHLV
jgi:hypothetical protein